MLGDGLKPDEPAPKKLDQADLDSATRVVTFCTLPDDLQAIEEALGAKGDSSGFDRGLAAAAFGEEMDEMDIVILNAC